MTNKILTNTIDQSIQNQNIIIYTKINNILLTFFIKIIKKQLWLIVHYFDLIVSWPTVGFNGKKYCTYTIYGKNILIPIKKKIKIKFKTCYV